MCSNREQSQSTD